jgi:hypothetical protein
MAKVAEVLNIGSREDLTIEDLLEIIEVLYTDLAVALNKKIELYERPTDGQSSDTLLPNGSVNINTNTNKVEILVARPTSTTVTWKEI